MFLVMLCRIMATFMIENRPQIVILAEKHYN